MSASDNSGSDTARAPHLWKPGQSGNPGGRPKKLVAIERMLDEEHRTVEGMRECFRKLKALAFDEHARSVVDKKGQEHVLIDPPDPAFTRLYLDRVLGPVREVEPDLSDAPEAVITYLKNLS